VNRYQVKFSISVDGLEASGNKEISADTFELALAAFQQIQPNNVEIIEVSKL
jgi:hypothetical protein